MEQALQGCCAIERDGKWVPYRKLGTVSHVEPYNNTKVRLNGTCIRTSQKYKISLCVYTRTYLLDAGSVLMALSRPAPKQSMILYIGISGGYEGWYIKRRASCDFEESLLSPREAPTVLGTISATSIIDDAEYFLVTIDNVPNEGFPKRGPIWFAKELFTNGGDNTLVLTP
jgi:hypothetical protein